MVVRDICDRAFGVCIPSWGSKANYEREGFSSIDSREEYQRLRV